MAAAAKALGVRAPWLAPASGRSLAPAPSPQPRPGSAQRRRPRCLLPSAPTVTARPRARAAALRSPGRAPARGLRGRSQGCAPCACVRACGGARAAAAWPPRVGLPPRRLQAPPRGTLGSGVPRAGAGPAPRRRALGSSRVRARAASVRACAAARGACAAGRSGLGTAGRRRGCGFLVQSRVRGGATHGVSRGKRPRPHPAGPRDASAPRSVPAPRLLPLPPEDDTDGQRGSFTCPRSLKERTGIKSNS